MKNYCGASPKSWIVKPVTLLHLLVSSKCTAFIAEGGPTFIYNAKYLLAWNVLFLIRILALYLR